MRRVLVVLPLLLAPLLGGCARTTDSFKPRITVSSTGSSLANRERSFLVEGYVLDDTGVTSISVDGKPIPILPGSRKLAHFQFKTLIQGEAGKYTIKAQDAAGNTSTLLLPVTVDAKPPTLTVTSFQRSGNIVRVAGVAKDNNRVSQITVDGSLINVTPGPEVEFYAETTGIWADVEITDSAGNVLKQRVR